MKTSVEYDFVMLQANDLLKKSSTKMVLHIGHFFGHQDSRIKSISLHNPDIESGCIGLK